MPNRNEMYPSKWLKAVDLPQPRTATIDACRVEVVGQGAKAERKPVLYFQNNTVKPLVVNQTNWDAVVGFTGLDDSDDWAGIAVELYAIDVTGPNGPTRGVRLRRPQPRRKAKPAPAVPAIDPDDPLRDVADGAEVPF